MSDFPKVTVIIPVFNREFLIQRAIKSLINQTYANWELIVVDDGSTDNTIAAVTEYMSKDSRIQLFSRNREPKNASTCRNIGAEKSNGQYLIFLDSDDELKPWCIEQRLKIMQQDTSLDIAIFKLAIKQADGREVERNIDLSADYLREFLSYNRMPWQTMCPIWRAEFFKKIEGFDERYFRHQDPELFIRVLLFQGLKMRVCGELTYDSVYYPAFHPHDDDYYYRVYKGSSVFVKQMSLLLDKKGLIEHKQLMKGYLSFYLRTVVEDYNNAFDQKKYNITNDLIRQYEACKVISSNERKALLFRLTLYFKARNLAFRVLRKFKVNSV